ncbi:hypothetical protein Bbelb_131780 [Branchiostoma belcheri]|nr:hypothetical protein Bbelb_131780 [Branchiostoma belcheri]
MAGQIEQNRVWVGLCAKRNVFSFGMDVKWSGFHYDEADVGLKTWKTSAGIVGGIISKQDTEGHAAASLVGLVCVLLLVVVSMGSEGIIGKKRSATKKSGRGL